MTTTSLQDINTGQSNKLHYRPIIQGVEIAHWLQTISNKFHSTMYPCIHSCWGVGIILSPMNLSEHSPTSTQPLSWAWMLNRTRRFTPSSLLSSTIICTQFQMPPLIPFPGEWRFQVLRTGTRRYVQDDVVGTTWAYGRKKSTLHTLEQSSALVFRKRSHWFEGWNSNLLLAIFFLWQSQVTTGEGCGCGSEKAEFSSVNERPHVWNLLVTRFNDSWETVNKCWNVCKIPEVDGHSCVGSQSANVRTCRSRVVTRVLPIGKHFIDSSIIVVGITVSSSTTKKEHIFRKHTLDQKCANY